MKAFFLNNFSNFIFKNNKNIKAIFIKNIFYPLINISFLIKTLIINQKYFKQVSK